MLPDVMPDTGEVTSNNKSNGNANAGEIPAELMTNSELGDFDNDSPQPINQHFNSENIAEKMEPSILSRIAQDVINWVDSDEESRKDWCQREIEGIRALGVSGKPLPGAKFDGASTITHPLLMEGCTQFQARALAELWPSDGPVKCQTLGTPTEDTVEQSVRVEDYMNYQYTTVMPGAFDETDKLLMRLPMSGSVFKKISFDPICKMIVSKMVEPADFITPYTASSLISAQRFTHRIYETQNDLLKKIENGYYIRHKNTVTPYDELDFSALSEEVLLTEGRTRSSASLDDDSRFTLYECHCYLNIDWYENGSVNRMDSSGDPYIVTVDSDSQQVLSIRRSWNEDDEMRKRRMFFSHYKFLPGMGFYGFGFFHTIGGLGVAATGALRALLDAAYLANSKGGFVSRDARIPATGCSPLAPGEWREVEASSEELRSAFYPMDYKEPSKTLYEILGHIDELGRRYASTTENMIGDANNNGPVGTTLALIEQGSKVFTGIHKRLHYAQSVEFSIVAKLNAEYLDDEYPYYIGDQDKSVFAADFDDRIDIIPVSDPNIISSTQRIAQAQSILSLSKESPEIYDQVEVHKRLLQAMQVSDYELLMNQHDEIPERDPVSEGVSMLNGEAVKTYPDQSHEAHMIVHQHWFQSLSQAFQKTLEPVFMSHMAEHTAWIYRAGVSKMVGIEVPTNQQYKDGEVDFESMNIIAELVANRIKT